MGGEAPAAPAMAVVGWRRLPVDWEPRSGFCRASGEVEWVGGWVGLRA